MAETVNFTVPIVRPNQTSARIERLIIDIETKTVMIQWLGNNNEPASAVYPTPAPIGSNQPSGAQLITTLNKMNFAGANPSLANRILARLQSDGYIGAGTVTGTPD
jgi:hypothetical protein